MIENQEPKNETKEENVNKSESSQSISIDAILNSYPADREKAKSYLLLGIHNNLHRIANALEYFANKDITKEKAKEISKDG
jgi:ATP-dependent protease Clp ATPase subunit